MAGIGARAVNSTLLLAFGVAVTTLCCAPPFGIPAILYALRARRAVREETPAVATRCARASIVFSALGALAGLVFELFLLVRHLAAGFQ